VTRGVVYIATGNACYEECIKSAKSVKEHNPHLKILIFSERTEVDPVFDEHRVIEAPSFSNLDKVRYLWMTPFEETLFLDSDTFITAGLDSLFDGLKYCDLLGALAHGFEKRSPYTEIPNSLWEINTGVLLFNNSDFVIQMLKAWPEAYERMKSDITACGIKAARAKMDQPSFRQLLWSTRDVRFGVLPPEYNLLRYFGSALWGKAIIVHGRANIEEVARRLNKRPGNRIFLQGGGVLHEFYRHSFLHSIGQWLRLGAGMLAHHLSALFPKLKGPLRNRR
jgi:hypothetical protein